MKRLILSLLLVVFTGTAVAQEVAHRRGAFRGGAAATISTDKLVAWYDFDDATDSHNFGPWDLTEVGTPSYAAGIGTTASTERWYSTTIDEAILHSDIDCTIAIRMNPISGWVTNDDLFRIRNNGNQYLKWLDTDNFQVELHNIQRLATGNVHTLNSYYIVVWTYTSATASLELWVDGVSLGTSSSTYVNTGSDTMSINNALEVADWDYVGIWDGRVLTDAEIGVFSATTQYSDFTAGSAPVPDLLWWQSNQGTGTAVTGSSSGGSDDGTTDADWSFDTRSGTGSALDFVKANADEAEADGSIAYGSSVITMSCWAKFDGFGINHFLISTAPDSIGGSGDNGACLWYSHADLGIQAQIRGTSGTYRREHIAYSTTGTWVHILAVFDHSTTTGDVKIWLDGVEQTLTTTTDDKNASGNFATAIPHIGHRHLSSSYTLDGYIDDIRIYGSDVSADVLAIKNAVDGGVPDPDLLWWKVQDSTTLTDDSTGGTADGTHDATRTANSSGSDFELTFDGTTDEAQTDGTINIGTDIITVSFWLDSDLVSDEILLELGPNAGGSGSTNEFYIYLTAADDIRVVIQDDVTGTTSRAEDTTTAIVADTLTHFFAVLDNSTNDGEIDIWLDGVKEIEDLVLSDKTGFANFKTETIYVGARGGSSLRHAGLIDDVRIWTGDQRAYVGDVFADHQ